ncbi:MAG: hypothetical protein KatS3mg115_2251 [Candidatus Poribacteria bacterium]|nr:MAG: hypothetical protein KatS3mg115_2251 [Candidatus Poribacteria bacterium]
MNRSVPDSDLDGLPEPAARAFKHNFRIMALYQIFMRMGWIYKTESTVIPGFVTALTSNPLWISITPIISRLAQFLPPFLFLDPVQRAERQKPLLLIVLGGFAAAWGVLALLLWSGLRRPELLLTLFFLLYGIGWLCVGVERLLMRVLTGRLIPIRRRGRLFAVAGPFGSFSVLLSGPVIAHILGQQEAFPQNFAIVFGLAFFFFGITWLCALLLREPPYPPETAERRSLKKLASDGCRLLREDSNFRRIFAVEAIRSLAIYLFSYYVAYARTWSADPTFHAEFGRVLGWGLTLQNLVIGSLSLVLGLLVDWKGNRVVLRTLCTISALVPLFSRC